MSNRDLLTALGQAFDEVWAGLDRIAQSRMTLPSQADGFIEGYEAGLREARGIALAAMADAYRPWGDPDSLPNEMVRLGGARLQVARIIADLLATTTPPAAADTPTWLIERGQPEGLDRPEWWAVTEQRTRAMGWTRDAWQAIRYPSRESAEATIARFDLPSHPIHARAVEHGFVTPPAPAPDLDVERLARAMRACEGVAWPRPWVEADFDWVARQVAAAYRDEP